METRISGVAASPAPRVSAPSAPAAARSQPAAETPKPAPVADKVTLSTKGGSAVENHGSNAAAPKENPAKGDNSAAREKAPEAKPVEISTKYAQFNTNLSRSYSVESNDRLVMKVTQKDNRRVVKEIPARQERLVKDAIVRYIENDGDMVNRAK
ncbi:MAG: hypothetical protein HZB29_01405 [Nitrospinae bacterium]|nr:hypothetical protein [Nitrospinota bacterium]